LFQRSGAALHDQCPMVGICFVDQPRDAALPVPVFIFGNSLAGYPTEPPAVEVIDQGLAYILFASGSTGNPKGVRLSHLNALAFVNWGVETFGITADDRL